jgi:hypothetical protein
MLLTGFYQNAVPGFAAVIVVCGGATAYAGWIFVQTFVRGGGRPGA